MSDLLQSLVDALSLGALFALLGLGIALVFGVAGVINFAHGEIIMICAYCMYFLAGLPWPVVVVATCVVGMALAWVINRVAIAPLSTREPATALVSTFALGMVLQNVVVAAVGARPKTLDFGSSVTSSWTVGTVRIPQLAVVTVIIATVLLSSLALLLKRTRVGIHLRAAAYDMGMARMLGVRAQRVIALAFVISGVFAAAAAILIVVQTGSLTPTMGLQPVLIAFIATVIGGMGSLVGAALGGLVLGVATVLLQVVLPPSLQPFRDSFVYALVIAVLVLRPQGLISVANAGERV